MGHPDSQDSHIKEGMSATIKVKDMKADLKENIEIFVNQYFEAYREDAAEEEVDYGYFMRTWLEWVLLEYRAFHFDDR